MKRRHINEFYKTSLANKGRAVGIGISYDNYDEESGLAQVHHNVHLIFPNRTEEEKASLNGEVIVYKYDNSK